MNELNGSITTYTGRRIWPLKPKLNDINILDICHALSNQCRFTGHTREFYSVGEHSCRVSDLLPQELKLTGLLHDASEYALLDLARPVKEQPEMYLFREAEDTLMYYIARKFNLIYPFPKEIKAADKTLLVTEYRDLMAEEVWNAVDWNGYKPLDTRIVPWSPAKTKFAMIDRLEKLGIKVER